MDFRVPQVLWIPCKGSFFFERRFARMTETIEISGHIAPSVFLGEDDDLLLQPVYLVPVEVFTTGLLARPEYRTITVMVDGVGGRVSVFAGKNIQLSEGEPSGKKLPVNVTLSEALQAAESAAFSEGRGGWRALARSAHVMAIDSQIRMCWKVWVRNGENLVDSVSGKSLPLGDLVGLLLPGDEMNQSRD